MELGEDLKLQDTIPYKNSLKDFKCVEYNSLDKVVESLPYVNRVIFNLKFIDGLTDDEIL